MSNEARDKALTHVTRNDAPDGQGWFCPNCDHWASIGGNASYHALKTEHDIPTLKAIPAHVETLSRPAVPQIVPGDTVFFHFMRIGAESKLEHRTRPAIVTSIKPDDVARLYVFFEPWDSVGKWPLTPEFVEDVRRLSPDDRFRDAPLIQRWSPRSKP